MQALDQIFKKYTQNEEDANKVVCALGALATRDNGLVYVGGSGLKDITNQNSDINIDSTLAFFSCTKAVTTTALLKLLQDGKIESIDDPIEKYTKEIKDIKMIKGFDSENKPILVEVQTKPTIRHILTHTAGFGYSFFNHTYKTLYDNDDCPDILKSNWEQFATPLLFEPGTKWHYGTNTDWVGKVVYDVSGMSLGDYCKKNIFEPIGASSLTFERTEDHLNDTIEIHQRDSDGKLSPLKGILTVKPQFHPGGHGLYGTIRDFMKFLEIFLHDGKSPQTGVQILKPETVHNYSFKNILPEGVAVESTLEYSYPELSNEVTIFENYPKDKQGWTASFHKIDIDLPTGRAAGNYNWAGLPNLYYWIDVKKGVVGMFATQLFPFLDPVALQCFQDFETEAYKTLA